MKKHLPFCLYAIFSTLAVIITILLPVILSQWILSDIARQCLAAVIGVLISLTGSWMTYIKSYKEMTEVKKTTTVVDELFMGKRTIIIDGNGVLPLGEESSGQ